jgi:uncharacterized protein
MILVIADTSGLLAALDLTHPDRDAARTSLDDAGVVIVSPLLLSEFDHVARRVLGGDAASRGIDDIRRWARIGRFVLPEVTADLLDVAEAVREQYRDLKLDLADAVNVALAAKYRTNVVLTLDHRDFRALRPLTDHASFHLLPGDG